MATILDQTVWESVLSRLQILIDPSEYKNWFQDTTKLVSYLDGILIIHTPKQFHATWLRDHYQQQISTIMEDIDPDFREVVFEVGGNWTELDDTAKVFKAEVAKNPDQPRQDDWFPKNTYPADKFAIGSCNALAHGAITEVIARPCSYPLIAFFGPTSTGKTFLLNIAEQSFRKNYPGVRLIHQTAEEWLNELSSHLKRNTMVDFRKKFRTAKVFLIDEADFLAGKPGVMEEFKSTLDALYGQAQIIMTFEQDPRQPIAGMRPDLRARMATGLTIELHNPNADDRQNTLKLMAIHEGLKLSKEICDLIVENSEHFRDLAGAIANLSLSRRLSGGEITLELAKEALRFKPKRIPTPQTIMEGVAKVCFFRDPKKGLSSLRSGARTRNISRPRHIGMWLTREYFPELSLTQIALLYKVKDHTSAIYACQTIERELRTDAELDLLISRIRREIEEI